jgi:hypothetical protein
MVVVDGVFTTGFLGKRSLAVRRPWKPSVGLPLGCSTLFHQP